MIHLDLVQTVAAVTAFAFAASKLFKASLPFWQFFKYPIVQRIVPGAILVLGALPAALSGVTSWTDFGVAILGALALALPGTHAALSTEPAKSEPEKPKVSLIPPVGPATLAFCIAAALAAQACALFDPAKHPIPAECAAVAPGVRGAIESILMGPGDWDATLVAFAEQYGWQAVLCVVKEFSSLVASDADGNELHKRSAAFLAKHGEGK